MTNIPNRGDVGSSSDKWMKPMGADSLNDAHFRRPSLDGRYTPNEPAAPTLAPSKVKLNASATRDAVRTRLGGASACADVVQGADNAQGANNIRGTGSVQGAGARVVGTGVNGGITQVANLRGNIIHAAGTADAAGTAGASIMHSADMANVNERMSGAISADTAPRAAGAISADTAPRAAGAGSPPDAAGVRKRRSRLASQDAAERSSAEPQTQAPQPIAGEQPQISQQVTSLEPASRRSRSRASEAPALSLEPNSATSIATPQAMHTAATQTPDVNVLKGYAIPSAQAPASQAPFAQSQLIQPQFSQSQFTQPQYVQPQQGFPAQAPASQAPLAQSQLAQAPFAQPRFTQPTQSFPANEAQTATAAPTVSAPSTQSAPPTPPPTAQGEPGSVAQTEPAMRASADLTNLKLHKYAPYATPAASGLSPAMSSDEPDLDDDERDAVPSSQMAQPAPVPLMTVEPPRKRGRALFIVLLVIVLLAAAALALWQTGVLPQLLGVEKTDVLSIPSIFATAAPEGDKVSAAIPVSSSRVDSFSADAAEAAAPATIGFSAHTSAGVTDIRLLSEQGSSLYVEGIKSTPDETGILWEFTVKFDDAFEGDIRAYIRDADGVWDSSGASLHVSVK